VHGSGFSSVLAGGALLLMATFVPFAILRMIPAVEAGAVSHLDGLRERGTAAVTRGLPRTAASHALHEGLGAIGDARLMAQTAAAGGRGGKGAAGGGVGAGGVGGDAAMAADGESDPGSLPGIPMAQGDAEATREAIEELTNRVPRPKGPKPLLPAPGSEPTEGESASGSGWAIPSTTAATGFEPDPADRVGARKKTGLGGRIGPATPEDAWMWQGVPPGRALIRPYRPGERRYYMGDNNGPSLMSLPPAWPPGQEPDA
jgi:hypothetical protein